MCKFFFNVVVFPSTIMGEKSSAPNKLNGKFLVKIRPSEPVENFKKNKKKKTLNPKP